MSFTSCIILMLICKVAANAAVSPPPNAPGCHAEAPPPRGIPSWPAAPHHSLSDQLSHAVAILLSPPLTQRYFTGAVAEGVSGELQYCIQRAVRVNR